MTDPAARAGTLQHLRGAQQRAALSAPERAQRRWRRLRRAGAWGASRRDAAAVSLNFDPLLAELFTERPVLCHPLDHQADPLDRHGFLPEHGPLLVQDDLLV